MGKYNSSTYRVCPLMEHISGNLDRINRLLSVFGINVNSLPLEYCYGDDEKLLKPSLNHLLGLIQYLGKTKNHKENDVSKDRAALFYGTEDERKEKTEEAVSTISKKYSRLSPSSRGWYIFEGYTHPDIFIEGEDYIIIGEGKWTENHITVETTHLLTANNEYRNQMIRHIQAAINYSNKKVYAFYLVDKDCGYLGDLTKDEFKKQLSMETVKLSEKDKKGIEESFYGYITWQDINDLFPEIKFLSKEEIDKKLR